MMNELLQAMGFNPHYVKIEARHVQGGYFDLLAVHTPTNTRVEIRTTTPADLNTQRDLVIRLSRTMEERGLSLSKAKS